MTELSLQEHVRDDAESCTSLDGLPEERLDAFEHSAAASKHLHDEDYNCALLSYRQALHLYKQQGSTIGQCNAAATLHNMALLHRRCHRYDLAVRCFREAEDIYRSCSSRIIPGEGKDGVCLEYLMADTLHNRAFVHSKYEQDVPLAIECHEQVVEMLLKDDDGDSTSPAIPPTADDEDAVFIKLNKKQRVQLLVESLKNLGVFYSQSGETEGALGAFEEALEFCREEPENREIQKSMATVLINLASVYFSQQELKQALHALQDAMNVWMAVKEDPSNPEVLATLNNMGLAHERMGDLDKALECYEDLLHVRSQVLGEDHVDVADSLSSIAKLLERQGNTEGALDLYHEAIRIYKRAATDQDPSLLTNVAELDCRIASILMEEGQVDESIDKYQEALQMDHSTLGMTSVDTATIYHGLGRAYMAKHQFSLARECLLKAARLLAAVPADNVHIESLVESSEMLKQALNESLLSSDGSWVNSEIFIAKTPERMALASIGMNPIVESSLSYEDFQDGSESQQLSSQSSQLHLSALPSTTVDSSSEMTVMEEATLVTLHKSPPSSPRNDAPLPLTTSGSSSSADKPARSSFCEGTLSPLHRFMEEEFNPYSSPVSPESYGQSRTRDPGKVAVEARQASVLLMADIGSPLRSLESGHETEHGEVEATLEEYLLKAPLEEPSNGAMQSHDDLDFPHDLDFPREESMHYFLRPAWNSHSAKAGQVVQPDPRTSPQRMASEESCPTSSSVVVETNDISVNSAAIASPSSRSPIRNDIRISSSSPLPLAEASGVDVSAIALMSPREDIDVKGECHFAEIERRRSSVRTFGSTSDDELNEDFLHKLVMEFSNYDESISESNVETTDYTNESLAWTASAQSDRGKSGSFTSNTDSDGSSSRESVSFTSDASSDGESESRRRSPSNDESDYIASDRVTSKFETDGKNDAHRLPTVVGASADSSFNLSKLDTTDDDADADAVLHSSFLNETDSTDVSDYIASDRVASEPETGGENDAHRLPAVVDNTASADSSFNLSKLDTTNDDADADAVLHSSFLNETDSTDASDYIASDRVASEPETGGENDARSLPAVVDNTASVDSSFNLSKLDTTDDGADADADVVRHSSFLNETDSTGNGVAIKARTSGVDYEKRDAFPGKKSPPKCDLDASLESGRMSADAKNLWWSTPPTEQTELEMSDDDTTEPLLANSASPQKKNGSPRTIKISSARTIRGSSPRERFAKAIGGTFRRSRRQSRLDSMPEDEEHNGPPPVMDDQRKVTLQDDPETSFPVDSSHGPISFVALECSSGDDNVSQITFLGEETNSVRNESGGSWWWGVTQEGLEGWFPVVVGAAEEFLSAQSIFDKVKARKREMSSTDSTDEVSDPFGDLSEDEIEEETKNRSEGMSETHILRFCIERTTIENGPDIESPIMEEQLDNTIEPAGDDVARPSPPETKDSKKFAADSAPSIQERGCSPRIRSKVRELEKTLHNQRIRLGQNHPDVASTLIALAMLQSQAGEREIPVMLLREALCIKKSIGDQAEIARTLHRLGDVYSQQNQFNAALTCHREALKYERSVYGSCHLEIASTLNTIGTVHAELGEFDVAMSNHQHALKILKDCVGEDLSHPLVAQTLICIGAVYYKERNSLATIRANTDDYSTFIEAGMLDVIARAHEERGSYRMAISFFEEKLQLLRNVKNGGMDQREVVEALTRLGTLSRKAGVFFEALDYYEEAAIIQSALGRDQVEIAKESLFSGTVHYHLGHFRHSLKLLKETLSILQATVGTNQQVLVAETLQRMGMVQIELCEFDSAMKALEKALTIQNIALGKDHPATLQTRLAIAVVFMNQAELDSSIEQFTAVLGIQSRVHGPKHPNLARTMYYIARAYEWKGDIATATKFFEESFFMADDFLGHDHPAQASTLHAIADLQRQKRRYKKSLQIVLSVLDMRKETLGERHIDVAMTLCSIASCQAAVGRFADSLKVFDDALSIAEEAVGSTHPSVAQIYVEKGSLFLRKCQFEEAREMIEKGLEIYGQSNVVEGHPRRVEAKLLLERVERDELLCV